MEGVDDESLQLGYGITENLRCLARVTPGMEGTDVLLEGNGVIADWTDQGRAYHAVFEKRHYQRRPQRTIILSDEVWNTHIRQFFNVLLQCSGKAGYGLSSPHPSSAQDGQPQIHPNHPYRMAPGGHQRRTHHH